MSATLLVETRVTHPTATCCWCRASLVKKDAFWWCATPACTVKQREGAISLQAPIYEDGKLAGFKWEYWYVPLPTQAEFERIKAPRKLLGGAAGPGKSFAARKGAYRRALRIPGLNILLVRKTFPELERTHIRAMRREASELSFEWHESRREARFKNGSTIECGHLEDTDAVQKYLSAEYDLIIIDEAVQIPPVALMELMSRARTSNAAVIAAGGAEVWLVTNPGGPSHALLHDLFILKTPDVETYPAMATSYQPAQWAHIRATLDDNPYIDPQYESLALSGLRRARYAQLRHGDWDSADGAFFEEFSARTHGRRVTMQHPVGGVVESVDWGFSSAGCVGWFAPLGDNHWHCLAEWKFRQLTAEEVAAGILQHRQLLGIEHVAYTVVDPSMFNKTGHGGHGESYAETFARFGVPCRRGDHDRKMGWGRLAAWFRLDTTGTPWLTFDTDCKYLLRSLPALLCDSKDPEDIDSSLDDHGADMTRYFVMSRPPLWSPTMAPTAPPAPGTWAWWKQWHQRRATPRGVLR